MNIKISPKAKRDISRILPFGVIWFLLGNIFLFIEAAAVDDVNVQSATAIQLNWKIYIFATLAVFGVGLLVGTIEVFYLSRKFANKSFLQKIGYKTLVYILLLFVIIQITFPIAASMELNTTLTDPRVWDKFAAYLTSKTYLSTNFQLAVELVASLFYFEISENIGQGIMTNFFTGRYHHPRQERRIFMFLDMKSSTAIAEKLGHIRYFELLNTYYKNLSDAIVHYEGEIYQYVGDEVIVSWELDKGIRNANCLRCFYAMKADLESQSETYIKSFEVQPSFKAGLHCGEVTTGEIGALKKEIIFTGDTLNATSRIQSLCNEYGVDILLSEDLVNTLDTSAYRFRSLGKNELRGKQRIVEIFTIEDEATAPNTSFA